MAKLTDHSTSVWHRERLLAEYRDDCDLLVELCECVGRGGMTAEEADEAWVETMGVDRAFALVAYFRYRDGIRFRVNGVG